MSKFSLFTVLLFMVEYCFSQSKLVNLHVQKDATYLLDSTEADNIVKSLNVFLKSKDHDRDILTNPENLKENVEPFFWLNNLNEQITKKKDTNQLYWLFFH